MLATHKINSTIRYRTHHSTKSFSGVINHFNTSVKLSVTLEGASNSITREDNFFIHRTDKKTFPKLTLVKTTANFSNFFRFKDSQLDSQPPRLSGKD